MSVRVGQLWHYPVKSMQGEPTDEVILGPGGVVGDRAYGFVDVDAGRLISAKHPKRYAYAEVVTPGTVRVGDAVAVEPSRGTGGPLANVMLAMASALQSGARGT